MSNQLRHLFVTMLLFCEIGDEYMFFENVWKLLTDDIQYNMHQVLNHPNYQMNENELRSHLLDTLGTIFNKRGTTINDFNLPKIVYGSSTSSTNHYITTKLNYDVVILSTDSKNMISQLNDDQLHAFRCIVDFVLSNNPNFFFISGYRGTGKTFLWNTIITYLREKRLYCVWHLLELQLYFYQEAAQHIRVSKFLVMI
jgi:chromosomal replication initiation ATPase DnaA